MTLQHEENEIQTPKTEQTTKNTRSITYNSHNSQNKSLKTKCETLPIILQMVLQ